MNRIYLLFTYNYNYPSGGLNDCHGMFPSSESAKKAFRGDDEYAQVGEISNGVLKIVAEGTGSPDRTPRRIEWKDVSITIPSTA